MIFKEDCSKSAFKKRGTFPQEEGGREGYGQRVMTPGQRSLCKKVKPITTRQGVKFFMRKGERRLRVRGKKSGIKSAIGHYSQTEKDSLLT